MMFKIFDHEWVAPIWTAVGSIPFIRTEAEARRFLDSNVGKELIGWWCIPITFVRKEFTLALNSLAEAEVITHLPYETWFRLAEEAFESYEEEVITFSY